MKDQQLEELLKKHFEKEAKRFTLKEAIQYYNENNPRGEYVLVIEGATESNAEQEAPEWEALSITEHVEKYIAEGKTSKEAIKQVATERGLPKRDVYNEYHGV